MAGQTESIFCSVGPTACLLLGPIVKWSCLLPHTPSSGSFLSTPISHLFSPTLSQPPPLSQRPLPQLPLRGPPPAPRPAGAGTILSCFPCPWLTVSPAQPTPWKSLTPEREQALLEGVFKSSQDPGLLGAQSPAHSLPPTTLTLPQHYREVIPSEEGPQISCESPFRSGAPEGLAWRCPCDFGQGHNPSELAFGVSTFPQKTFLSQSQTLLLPAPGPALLSPDQSISPSLPPSDPAFSKKGSKGLTPTQAITMNNGLMWVCTGDSNATLMREFQALRRVSGVRALILPPLPKPVQRSSATQFL